MDDIYHLEDADGERINFDAKLKNLNQGKMQLKNCFFK